MIVLGLVRDHFSDLFEGQGVPIIRMIGNHVSDPPNEIRIWVGPVDKFLLDREIILIVKEATTRRQTVPSSATDLLIIALDGFGKLGVHDKTDVRFVYAHTESVGGEKERDFSGHESFLDHLATIGMEFAVVSFEGDLA
jgi:hypothetical protein